MKYIAVDGNGQHGIGNSLEEAFDDYRHYIGSGDNEDLTVYECVPIEVEFKIVKKTKPVKVIQRN
jgi:hypothetical protein